MRLDVDGETVRFVAGLRAFLADPVESAVITAEVVYELVFLEVVGDADFRLVFLGLDPTEDEDSGSVLNLEPGHGRGVPEIHQ